MLRGLARPEIAEKGKELRQGLGSSAVVSLGSPTEPQRKRFELRRAPQDAQPRVVRAVDEHARQSGHAAAAEAGKTTSARADTRRSVSVTRVED